MADRAGVSRTTVSFVLNQVEANISPETRERVLEAASELGYVPDAAARALVRRQTYTLALVIIRESSHLASDAFLPMVMQGLIQVVRPAGFRLLLEPVARADTPDLYLSLVKARHIDGILLSGPRSDDVQLMELIESGFPVVLLGQLPGSGACSVDIDNRRAARMAVDHLIAQGHRRIGCITNGPLIYTSSAARLDGYKDALADHGLSYDPALVRAGAFGPESGRAAALDLLSGGNGRPTALFVASDVVAMGAISAIHELDLNIPHEVALVGFDDVPFARYLVPSLTTVRLPAFELGQQAGELMLSITHKSDCPRQELLLDTELVVRESSGS